MSLLNRFIDNIQHQNLFQKKDLLLLAVSGGVDSIVLCELCRQAGFRFAIAHCNFKLREAESDRDELFVQSLQQKYNTQVLIRKFETKKYAEENKLSIQVAARELRYTWFNELLIELAEAQTVATTTTQRKISGIAKISPLNSNAIYLLTAHHANDNIETVLMNFFKGTGIRGLRGILPKQGKIIRPLLFATKEEIVSFANENKLAFVEDSSNLSDKYTRNYFRNQLIPSIKNIFPEVENNLTDNIERFKDIDVLYQQALHQHKKKLLAFKGKEVHIPVLKLIKTEPLRTIIYEITKDYGFTAHQADEIIHLLKSESGKYISSSTHKIINNRKWLIITPANTNESSLIIIKETDKEIDFEGGRLTINQSDKNVLPKNGNYAATLDMKLITFPLILRKWKQGDYFYPLGMKNLQSGKGGKKKLSRFFIDQKLSMIEKENVWVIESNKRIIWVVGRRIDDRFKVTEHTKKTLHINFKER